MNDEARAIGCDECEDALLGASDVGAAIARPEIAAHVTACASCGGLASTIAALEARLDAVEAPAPPVALVEAVISRFQPEAAPWAVERARPHEPSRDALWRVVAAGLLALPLVAFINLAGGWALWELATTLLPRAAALYVIGVFTVWTSLGIALGYASLPFVSLVRGGTATGEPGRPEPALAGR